MDKNKDVSLRDLLNYEAETYLNVDDISWIQSTFKNNPRAIHTLRKCFMPTVLDLPVEEMTNDVWFKGGFDPAQVPDEHLKPLIVARQEVIKFIMGGLINLKQIANTPVASPMSEELRRKKDSTK
jgi:hypothetical protein